MDNPNPLYCNADYTYCRIIGKYAYIKEQKGIFRLDISHDTPTLEPLGWVYIDESSLINDDIYIWPLDDNIFILQHQNYIGRIYKYVGTK